MMKEKFWLMLLAIALVAGIGQANMLHNPSFEEGTFAANEPPMWWYDNLTTTYTSAMTWFSTDPNSGAAHSGSKYIKMNSYWSWTSSTGWCWQTVNVTEGAEYAFSVWAKCPVAGETSEAWGYIDWLGPGSVVISESWLPLGWDVGSNWTYTEFGTVTAPASAIQAVYYLAGVLGNSAMGVLFDDAYMDIALPSLPSPNWEALVAIGDVDLSWTNLAPNDPNDSMYVDVWFGTEPNELSLYNMVKLTLDPVSGQDVTSATVDANDLGTYYWQVNSYIYGDPCVVLYDIYGTDPNGWPVIKGFRWGFDVVADVPPSSADAGVDMITWSGELVALDATIVDDAESPVTIAWSTDNPPGTNIVLSDPNIEDPDVTITKIPSSSAMIVNPSFEDRLTGWTATGGGWAGTWSGTFGNKYYVTPTDGDWCAYKQGYPVGPLYTYVGGLLTQMLTETLTAGTTYTLEVDVVNDGYYGENVEYKVQLLAGGTVIAEDDDGHDLNPIGGGNKASEWQTSTVIHTPGSAGVDPNIGLPLGIRLVAKNNPVAKTTREMSFDNVHLTADPPFPAPELSTVELTVRASDEANPTYVLKDTMTINIYDDECAAARVGLGLAAKNPGDFDADCDTDLVDLDELVGSWLNVPSGVPTEPIIGSPDSDPPPYIVINPANNVKASSENPDGDYIDDHIVDNRGITGELHTNVPEQNMWLSDPSDEDPNVFFDLGAEYNINRIQVWNYNDGAAQNTKYGIDELIFKYGSATNPNARQIVSEITNFTRATGDADYAAEEFSAASGDFTPFTARYILFDIVSNYAPADQVGLSEVRFFSDPSPWLPTVDPGNDWTSWSGQAVVVDANVVNNDPGKTLAYKWTAEPNSPAGGIASVVFDPSPYVEDPCVTITKVAPTGNATSVTMTLTVTHPTDPNTVSDSMVITLYDNACRTGKAQGTVEIDPADINIDCDTDLSDFAAMGETWLEDYELDAPAAKIIAISTDKATYAVDEPIVIEWEFAAGNNYDWIGVYTVGTPNNESYEFYWYLDGEKFGSRVVGDPGLAAGSYEARLFFNDLYVLEAMTSFVVE